ncbi:SRPBCC family protein [Methyloferula stellata]|uniref:SRPBCC family protein n=1 Tax=Methyloferula stellata TaxID=876270 RepID=UPI00036C411C|nr:SRPBCC family protein [Methyloferula stellata]
MTAATTATIVIEPVRITIKVKAPIDHAFEVFTAGLTRWWPANHGIGNRPIEKVLMEPRLGGRWLEFAEDGTQTVVATIIHWEPPHRVVLLWQVNAQWKPDAAMKSEVDVRFTPDGADVTNVELVHHKFETLGAADGASMRKDVDGGWPGLLEKFALESERDKAGA